MPAFSRAEYEYTVYQGEDKLRCYDPQPHPEDPELAETFPHHYHEPPDIKHHRRPARGLTSRASNLPALIAEVGKIKDEG